MLSEAGLTRLVVRRRRAFVLTAMVSALALAMVEVADVFAAWHPSDAEARQWCVGRWNQMRMSGVRTIAIVSARPRCSVTLADVYSPLYRWGCDRPARLYPGKPRTCLDRTIGFDCVINKYGAYECPAHANATGRLRGWNATL